METREDRLQSPLPSLSPSQQRPNTRYGARLDERIGWDADEEFDMLTPKDLGDYFKCHAISVPSN